MLTPQDVRAAQFEKNIRGYRTEEVDRFLDKVEEQLKQDEDQAEAVSYTHLTLPTILLV